MFTQTIENCFDSHVHWAATGQMATRLILKGLSSPEDVKKLTIEPHHYQGEWLIGWGWDQTAWPGQEYPHRRTLDELWPDRPVAFSRVDGHASWVNTEALKRVGFLTEDGKVATPLPEIQGGKIVLDEQGVPTGVLVDVAKSYVDALIPEPTSHEVSAFLQKGMLVFNESGFTHIRDMSCSEVQWNEAYHLDESGLLTLAVEQYFSAEDPKDFPKALDLALRARKDSPKNLRAQGLKIYYDGALGSEGAYISQAYASGSGQGLALLTSNELRDLLQQSWQHDFDVAVHVIGDEAADQVSQVAVSLWDRGLKGRLHLEHAEMMRPETVARLKGRDVICHIQPCHWLSDRRWIDEKLRDLKQYVFPWRALQENEVAFDFGSDSPIERPSIADNLEALDDSAKSGIRPLLGEPYRYHSYPNLEWTPNTYTHFVEGKVENVVFRGKHLF